MLKNKLSIIISIAMSIILLNVPNIQCTYIGYTILIIVAFILAYRADKDANVKN